MDNNIPRENIATLENALRKRVQNPIPLLLQLGVVNPLGDRKVLAIPEGANVTMETHVFCAKYNITSADDCDGVWKMLLPPWLRLSVTYIRCLHE